RIATSSTRPSTRSSSGGPWSAPSTRRPGTSCISRARTRSASPKASAGSSRPSSLPACRLVEQEPPDVEVHRLRGEVVSEGELAGGAEGHEVVSLVDAVAGGALGGPGTDAVVDGAVRVEADHARLVGADRAVGGGGTRRHPAGRAVELLGRVDAGDGLARRQHRAHAVDAARPGEDLEAAGLSPGQGRRPGEPQAAVGVADLLELVGRVVGYTGRPGILSDAARAAGVESDALVALARDTDADVGDAEHTVGGGAAGPGIHAGGEGRIAAAWGIGTAVDPECAAERAGAAREAGEAVGGVVVDEDGRALRLVGGAVVVADDQVGAVGGLGGHRSEGGGSHRAGHAEGGGAAELEQVAPGAGSGGGGPIAAPALEGGQPNPHLVDLAAQLNNLLFQLSLA